MRRILLTVTLLLTFLIPSPRVNAGTPLVDRVLKSTVRLIHPGTDEEGNDKTYVCTGFQVSPTAVLTAAHCLDKSLYVDYQETHVLKVNPTLALLSTPTVRPILEVRKSALKIGEPLTAFGYAYGFMMVFGRNLAGLANGDIVLDNPLSPGMSGGPVVDQDGKVVGIIQKQFFEMAIACGPEEIRDFLK